MPSTAAAIRDRIIALISAIVPDTLPNDRFRANRNEADAAFVTWAEGNADGAHRRFQVRDDGTEEPPEATNTDVDLRHVTFVIRVAYPQTGRYGAGQALSRDDVIAQDWRRINGLVGIYGRSNFDDAHDCTPLGAEREIEIGTSVDFLVIRVRVSFWFQQG